MKDINPDSRFLFWTTILGGVVAILLYLHFSTRRKVSSHSNMDLINNEVHLSEPSKNLLNVFDVSKKTPSQASAHKNGTHSIDNNRPFNSSYYYAHNNSKVGYKDGLSMEDYVMNQPKLLSRNGVNIQPSLSSTSEESKCDAIKESTNHRIIQVPKQLHSSTSHSIALNRYLWDDDGNSEGIAKLYFDSLPSSCPGVSENISWKDSGITAKDVKVKIISSDSNCALLIQIKRDTTIQGDETDKDTRYHFYVPTLYGQVLEAKAIVKSKLLIVKLIKARKIKGNSVAWPQIHAKGSPSKDYIDVDLFLEDTDRTQFVD